MVDRVVVCVDAERPQVGQIGGAAADQAPMLVEIAARWVLALGMSLTILNVAAPLVTLSGTAGTDDLEKWLADLADDASFPELDVDTFVEVNPVGTVNGVRSYLAAHPTGLLVVAAHAQDGLDRLIHGATSAEITAASTVQPSSYRSVDEETSHDPWRTE